MGKGPAGVTVRPREEWKSHVFFFFFMSVPVRAFCTCRRQSNRKSRVFTQSTLGTALGMGMSLFSRAFSLARVSHLLLAHIVGTGGETTIVLFGSSFLLRTNRSARQVGRRQVSRPAGGWVGPGKTRAVLYLSFSPTSFCRTRACRGST